MDLSRYTLGVGADVSQQKSKELSGPDIKNVKYIFIEPNNFYTLKNHFNYESLDFIFSENLINSTKFYRVLLKEWFNFCKVGGYILIKFKENKILNLKRLKKEVNLLFQDKVKIQEEFIGLNKEVYLALKKTKKVFEDNDDITRWSFGILTIGDNDKIVDMEIDSIKDLKIPHYEIIICGNYNGKFKNEKKVIIIPFDEKEKPGWITRKKNLICKKAKYENLVVSHDRYIFDKEWYKGMKKYGNYFEVLNCIIHDNRGMRAGDWLTYGTKWDNIARIGLLDYKDWDFYGFIGGGYYILKKFVWERVKWDEKIFWGESEDIILSRGWSEKGIVARFNPFSKVITLRWAHGKMREFKFNNQKLGKLKSGKLSLLRYIIKQFIKKKFLGKNILSYKG